MIVAIFLRGCKWLLPLVTALYLSPVAVAEPQAPTPGPRAPTSESRDEFVATVSAGLGANRADRWDSVVGGGVGLVWRGPRALLGVDASVDLIGANDGRAHVMAIAGWRLGSLRGGLGAGPSIRWDRVAPPSLGVAGGVWGLAGVAPYARAGVTGEGGFVELGIRVVVPVLRLRQR